MERKSIHNICIIIFFVFGTAITQADASVITVDDNGGGNYSTIQEAVNNAQNGDTILVSHGLYKENIKVNKELTILSHSTLLGDQTDRTYVIGAVPEEGIFDIRSSNVTIEGFHIVGSPLGTGFHKTGIYLERVQKCCLINNTFILNDLGIFLNGSQGNYISGNLISLGSDGISLNDSENNIMLNNLVVTNSHGILLNNSFNNTLINNTANSSTIGIYQTNGSIDFVPRLNEILSDNSSENVSSNKNILLFLLNEKYSTDLRNTQEKSDVVEATELEQINTSLQRGPVFLKIGAEWCPTCRSMKPIIKELATEYGGKATIMSVDVDQSPKIVDYFGTRYIPDCSVIMGIENGEYVYMQENGNVSKDRSQARIVGLRDKEVCEKLLDLALLHEAKEKSNEYNL